MSTFDEPASQGANTATEAGKSGLFVRSATGLVREVNTFTATIINYIPGCPSQVLAAGLFFAFALYPGGNFLLGLLLVAPIMLAFAYSFGLLTSAIPRSGGDYMLVSRVIHPAAGLISSFCMTMATVLSNAFFGIAFSTVAIGPGLIIIGLISGNQNLVSWGNTISTDKNWEFAIGALVMIGAALVLAGGWGWTLRVQAVLFGLTMLGLIICGLIALFTSPEAFMNGFNNFAKPITGSADTYHVIIKNAVKAGVNVNPPFSFGQTIPLIGVLAGFSIYTWWTTFIGGEIRQARTMKTANSMALAGILNLVSVAVFALIFIHTFGQEFLTAANASGAMPSQIASPPFYFFLVSAQVGNTALAVFLVISFAVFWPLITYISLLQPTRMIFAYAFDGILPKAVTKISRTHSPYVAVIIATILSIVTLYWGINSSSFFQVLVYAVLFQLIAMMLVGLSAVLFPYLRPALYRASTTTRTFVGIPVVTIAGAVAIASGIFLYVLYFTNQNLGFVDPGKFFTILAICIGLAVVYYFVARLVRSRQGVDLKLVYAEIPPE